MDQRKRVPQIPNLRPLIGLAALTAAYLQYYFLDVMLQVQSLPTLVLLPTTLGAG